MVFPQCLPVRHGNQRDALVLHVLVEVALDVHRHGASALVQDRVDRLVINQSGHGNALFLTPRKHVVPVGHGVPTALSRHEVIKAHFVQDYLQFFLVNAFAPHLLNGVRIDNLVSESALGEVWPLRDVEYLINGRLVHSATKNRPKFS